MSPKKARRSGPKPKARKKVQRTKVSTKVRVVAGVKVPPQMQLVNVYLNTKDPEKAVEFYQKAFGFKLKVTMPGPDGKIMHAELTHGDCTVMLGPENFEMGAKAPSTVGGTPLSLYIYVKDVDALTRRARAAGGNVVREPADQFYGDRVAVIVDPEGHIWGFATHQRIVPPEEMHPPSA